MAAALLLFVAASALGAPPLLCSALSLAPVCGLLWDGQRRDQRKQEAFDALLSRVGLLDEEPIDRVDEREWDELIEDWNRSWPKRCRSIQNAQALVANARDLPARLDATLGSVVHAADRQEEAVEETASLVANMRQSMNSISQQVDRLIESSEESASSILELGSSIDEVANNAAGLHDVVEASTSSVHEMSASIRQVSQGTEQVQVMAESTATSMTQMDRSVQEISSHATEAAALTERAHQGASAGREAVDATISDIERISALTSQAMQRLDGLVTRISQIGSILSAIDEINDETNLLSLNAAIIAAQAGEQGKAFLVVANHVKTLAKRTAGSTHDIEQLIGAIGQESAEAVEAMEAGIKAVATGVDRSRDAGRALESIQEACSEASERVGEIARSTSEQSRSSKGVAEATLNTSTQIQQIGTAIAEQKRASEAMLGSAESALVSCKMVHRSTDEQRATSRHITSSISAISAMIREIGLETRTHSQAGDAIGEAVMRLLENAQAAGSSPGPLQDWATQFLRCAEEARWPTMDGDSEGESPEVEPR